MATHTHNAESLPERGALVGTAISALFGVVWIHWAASGLNGTAAMTVRVVGSAIGAVILFRTAQLWSSVRRPSRPAAIAPSRSSVASMFSSRGYLAVVAVQAVSIGAGNKLLAATGHGDYAIAWTAAVVGSHFLALGRLFFAGFYWLGSALIVAGMAGTVVGLAGGGSAGIGTTAGLTGAASLFVAGAWPLLSRPSTTVR
jgi:hypothetical protein